MNKRTPLKVTNDPCLLTYRSSTYPSPLQVSTPQTPTTGRLNTFVVPPSTGPVYCNMVMIIAPVAPEQNALFAASPPPTASCSTGRWTITSMEIKSGRELGLDENLQYFAATFETRAPSDNLIAYNLVFGLQGTMALTPADCTIQVYENSGTTADPNTFTIKETTFKVEAATPQFYLQNFVSTAPASPTVPATDFANGAAIRFSWESNGTFFELYQKNVAKPIYSGTQTNFTMTGGVDRDTTFFLVAMVSGSPSGDSPFGGYQPIYLYDAVTVTISNPDLTPKSATISGQTELNGSLRVAGQTELNGRFIVSGLTEFNRAVKVKGLMELDNVFVDNQFTVRGHSFLETTTVGKALNVQGPLGVGGQATLGAVEVAGQATLANTIVGGTLTVNGNSILQSAQVNNSFTVSGATNLNGGLTAKSGPVSMITGPQSINPGKFLAKTDGLVIGVVSWPPGREDLLCVGWITGKTNGIEVVATGGNHAAFNSRYDRWGTKNGNSFVLPVSKGNECTLTVDQIGPRQIDAPTRFYWVPLGTAPSGRTFEWLSDQPPKLEGDVTLWKPVSKEKKVLALVDVIEEILKRPIEAESKEKLLNVLIDLQTEEFVSESIPGR